MKAVNAEQARWLDQAASAQFGIPSLLLMENAGRSVAQGAAALAEKIFGPYDTESPQLLKGGLGGGSGATEKRPAIIVLAGKGNNGGDGYVAARHLQQLGYEVQVFLLALPQQIRGDALLNLRIWQQLGPLTVLAPTAAGQQETAAFLQQLQTALQGRAVVIDAIFGSGFHGQVTGAAAAIIEAVNQAGLPIVAVDVPSGLEASCGLITGPCIRACKTITFAVPKVGLYMAAALPYVGTVETADISMPRRLTEQLASGYQIVDQELASQYLPQRAPDSHKGSCGAVLIIAGSIGMTGAAVLCAEAALRSGSGIVRLALPQSARLLAEMQLTEVITIPLAETARGTIAPEALPQLLPLLAQSEAVAIGPGLTTDHATAQLLEQLLPHINIPCVLDADALNIMAERPQLRPQITAPLIMTPHPGELARLLHTNVNELQNDRLAAAQKAVGQLQATVVVKGAATVIGAPWQEEPQSKNGAAPDCRLFINSSGNAGMATAGSGDVLTGIIASLCGQGLPPDEAAAAGVYMHGLAGDLAARTQGQMGLIAGDMLASLPRAWQLLGC